MNQSAIVQRKNFWDSHNNSQKLSTSLCVEADVRIVPLDGRALLVIQVPRATRTQRPVFINGNPLTGTYKRNYEGDYRCTETEVRQMLRDASSQLEELDRAILMLAHRFGEIGNADIQPYRAEHPRDIGDRLKFLVDHRWLERTGHGRGTQYRLPTGRRVSADEVATGSGHYEGRSGHYAANSGHYDASSQHYDAALYAQAAPVREKGRAPKELVEQTIETLCADDWLSLRTLAELLGRDADALRKHYITRMVREGKLEARFPGYPNHPDQAYKTSAKK